MIKTMISFLVFIFALVLTAPVLAEENPYNAGVSASAVSGSVSATLPAPAMKAYKAREVVITGSLTAISGKDLTVKLIRIVPAQMKNYPGAYPAKDSFITVKLVGKTKIVRKYNGKADFSELAIGDSIWVTGRLEADGTVTAQLVKDNSIHVAFFARKGEVTSIDSEAGTFMIKRDDKMFRIFVTTNTKFFKAGKTLAGLSALAVGDNVSVRGVIRQRADEITADSVTIVLDKSDEDARLQKIKEKEKIRLEQLKEKLEKELEKIKAQLEKLL